MSREKTVAGLVLISCITLTGIVFLFAFGDIRLSSSLREFALNHPLLLEWAKFISRYGNYFYYSLFLGFFLYGVIRNERKYLKIGILYLALQIIISVLITRFLKISIGRPRPGYGFVHHFFSGGYKYESFPSGHAVDASCSAGVLWGFLGSYLLILLAFLYSLLIGMSRIFLGAHYFLDVIAGMALGFTSGISITYRFLLKNQRGAEA
ncbi:MAG: phosphatase PAP2 family protein [Candidatus Aminicenantales bacterium]